MCLWNCCRKTWLAADIPWLTALTSPRELRLGCVAEIFLARWELFGEDSFREKFFGFFFRDGWKDHHTIPILLKDIENGEIQSHSEASRPSWIHFRKVATGANETNQVFFTLPLFEDFVFQVDLWHFWRESSYPILTRNSPVLNRVTAGHHTLHLILSEYHGLQALCDGILPPLISCPSPHLLRLLLQTC